MGSTFSLSMNDVIDYLNFLKNNETLSDWEFGCLSVAHDVLNSNKDKFTRPPEELILITIQR